MTWERGQKKELAERTGLHLSYIVDLTKGRRRATPENAVKLESAAKEMGIDISRLDWLYPKESTNPLIKGDGQ